MNLTEIKKEFLLNNFFKNEKFPGWRGIAANLIERGECIVAGEECIWKGGVGNFIKTSVAEGFFGCTRYEFDLTSFLTSNWVDEVLEHELIQIEEERSALIKRLEEEHSKLENKLQELKTLK